MLQSATLIDVTEGSREITLNIPDKPWKIRLHVPYDYEVQTKDGQDNIVLQTVWMLQNTTHIELTGRKNRLMMALSGAGDFLTLQCAALDSHENCASIIKRVLAESTKHNLIDPMTIFSSIRERYVLFKYYSAGRRFWTAAYTHDGRCINLTISKRQERWDDDQGSMAIIDSVTFVEPPSQ
jgi:hypothetical protein